MCGKIVCNGHHATRQGGIGTSESSLRSKVIAILASTLVLSILLLTSLAYGQLSNSLAAYPTLESGARTTKTTKLYSDSNKEMCKHVISTDTLKNREKGSLNRH